MSKNKNMKLQLAELRARAVLAKSEADIHKAADVISAFRSQSDYSFNHTWSYVGSILGCVMFMLAWWGQMDFNPSERLWVKAGGAVLAIGSLVVIYLRYKDVKTTGDDLYIRAAAIQAGIERDYDFNGKAYWQQLRSLFSMFDCGDEGQCITKRYLGGVDNTPFTLFEFKYVKVRRSHTTDSNGNSRTQKTRTTHYKYGMIVQFDNFNYLSLNTRNSANGFNQKWDSSSHRFNKLFKVRCSSEVLAAKFFEPKVVLKFEDDFSFVKALDLTSQSVACIELPKEVFPTQMPTPSLKNTSEYLDMLRSPAQILLLERTKELIRFINEEK
ncbi:hypothetical protein ISG33_06860 [Glaciecola sp. MH2013]|uniref:hypothetical protein n=1 Tax=Glaciecola sp. MH2013 TaxID=2785524 RepID=UPI0018A0CAC1|nr:hypothetical protein [Glaciecola sp. MH2013]MBF7073117.1 hypothetical protein [Glaciecola sp. MH2013]